MAQAAQGGGGVTVPGGVQELWRCGTEERGQWAWWNGLELDFGILEVFSNLYDSLCLNYLFPYLVWKISHKLECFKCESV